jgi:ElaB/YqjD/DUF883 family membrane-anchored ribosome-binding protein
MAGMIEPRRFDQCRKVDWRSFQVVFVPAKKGFVSGRIVSSEHVQGISSRAREADLCQLRAAPRQRLFVLEHSPAVSIVGLVPEDAVMGELLDALNTLDAGGAAPEEPKSTVDQAAKAFQSASRRVGEAADAARQPDMPLDVLTKLVRQVPLQSLAIAFVLGVMVSRR